MRSTNGFTFEPAIGDERVWTVLGTTGTSWSLGGTSSQLDEGTARLFGGTHLTRYELDYPAIDRKITATVLLDFARAVATGNKPEIGGTEARHAVAVVNALFESARLNRPVAIRDVEAGDPAVSGWQHELDAGLGVP